MFSFKCACTKTTLFNLQTLIKFFDYRMVGKCMFAKPAIVATLTEQDSFSTKNTSAVENRSFVVQCYTATTSLTLTVISLFICLLYTKLIGSLLA
nr:unnamed protein product [Callosobruchus chinensis]